MRKLFTLCLVVLALMLAAPSASAYSKELAEFAKIYNDELTAVGMSAAYEDPNLVVIIPENYFDADTVDAFASLSAEEMKELKTPFVESMLEGMGKETTNVIADFLQRYDAKMIIRLLIKGKKTEFVITPKELKL